MSSTTPWSKFPAEPTASQVVAVGQATESRPTPERLAVAGRSWVVPSVAAWEVTVTGVTEPTSLVTSAPTASHVVAPGGQATPKSSSDDVVVAVPGTPL